KGTVGAEMEDAGRWVGVVERRALPLRRYQELATPALRKRKVREIAFQHQLRVGQRAFDQSTPRPVPHVLAELCWQITINVLGADAPDVRAKIDGARSG